MQQQQQQHSQHEHGVHAGLGVRVCESDGGGRGSQAGGVPWTPGRLRHLLSNGLLRVSEVQVRGDGGGGVVAALLRAAAVTDLQGCMGPRA